MSAVKEDSEKEPIGPPGYVGNIWGWKFSFFSLALILFMVILMAVRYYQLPPEERVHPVEQTGAAGPAAGTGQ